MAVARSNLASSLAGLGNLTELRQRLLFLLGALVVFRISTHIPVPGINPIALAQLFNQQRGTILDMFNMFSGGALERFSVVALGIMPYISASIIMQLLTMVYPQLEQLRKEGESGRRKITQYTRYGTVGLATFQALGVAIALEGQQAAAQALVINPGIGFRITAVTTLVTGTLFLMWLGEQITERGVGNGISMIIFAGIVAGLPRAVGGSLELARTGELHVMTLVALFVLVIAVTALGDLRGKGPAPDHRELCQAPGRAQDVCGTDQSPAAQAQHVRGDPADLRLQPDPVSEHHRQLVR